MSDNRSLEDSQEISRITNEHTEIAALRAKRQTRGHRPYGITAGALSGVALFFWGTIFTEARIGPPEPITRTYLAILAASIVLGITAAAATFTWMITRIMHNLTAEQDRIRDYERRQAKKDHQRLVNDGAHAVLDALRAEEKAATQRKWERIASAELAHLQTGTDTHRFGATQGRAFSGDPSPVIPIRTRNHRT